MFTLAEISTVLGLSNYSSSSWRTCGCTSRQGGNKAEVYSLGWLVSGI